MNGSKTYAGIGLWLVGALLAKFFPEYATVAAVISDFGLGLAGIGAAHKLAKAEARTSPSNEAEPQENDG